MCLLVIHRLSLAIQILYWACFRYCSRFWAVGCEYPVPCYSWKMPHEVTNCMLEGTDGRKQWWPGTDVLTIWSPEPHTLPKELRSNIYHLPQFIEKDTGAQQPVGDHMVFLGAKPWLLIPLWSTSKLAPVEATDTPQLNISPLRLSFCLEQQLPLPTEPIHPRKIPRY